MKRNFTLLIAVVLIASVFTGCKKDNGDDELDTGSNNQLEYNGTKYPLKTGFVTNYGADENHINYDFIMVDGALGSEGEIENASAAIYLELFSAGTTAFKMGTYQFITVSDDDDYGDAKFLNKNFFADAEIAIDKNGNKQIDDNEFISVVGGTVTVSGTPHKYTVEFDLSLEDNKKAKGKFAGDFTYFDEDDFDFNMSGAIKKQIKF